MSSSLTTFLTTTGAAAGGGSLAGGMMTATIAIVMMPWKILATTQGYIFTWLVGYSALLGPVAVIMMVDYFLVRGTKLDHAELFDENAPPEPAKPVRLPKRGRKAA